MAHRRNRYIEASLKKIIGASPLIGLLGHRQVGKTTLLEKIAEAYYVLDLKSELDLAVNDPGNYVKTRAGHRVALDECQMAPPLFPALKEWVRIHKKPGQFLLSGSVRFTSRDAIRESLTGRIMNLELLPFSIPELLGEPLPHICFEALRANHFNHFLNAFPYQQSQCQKIHKEIPRYLEFGGLPSVCFLRDEKLRVQKINEQLQTILDRDI